MMPPVFAASGPVVNKELPETVLAESSPTDLFVSDIGSDGAGVFRKCAHTSCAVLHAVTPIVLRHARRGITPTNINAGSVQQSSRGVGCAKWQKANTRMYR